MHGFCETCGGINYNEDIFNIEMYWNSLSEKLQYSFKDILWFITLTVNKVVLFTRV